MVPKVPEKNVGAAGRTDGKLPGLRVAFAYLRLRGHTIVEARPARPLCSILSTGMQLLTQDTRYVCTQVPGHAGLVLNAPCI